MDANFVGFVALGTLILGLFAWVRHDIQALRSEMRNEIGSLRGEMRNEIGTLRGEIGTLRKELAELRERVARIEGLLEAVFMRRDLTPDPQPPLGPSGEPEAA